MPDLEFSTLNPLDQTEVDQWAGVVDRSVAAMPDFPTPGRTRRIVELTRSSQAFRKQHILAKVDGNVAATAELLLPQLDNRHLAELELDVDPAWRGHGVGSALLAEAERRIAADGRSTVVIFVLGAPERPEVGGRFAEKHGYAAAATEVRRRVDLDQVDESALDATLASAWGKAAGYELVQWVNRAPDDVVDGVAYLDGRLVQDAPMGDMDFEPEKVDAARVRDREGNNVIRGQLRLNSALRHVESGRIAGWTDIAVNAGEENDAWQGITLVDPDHRGRRIGTVLKIENQRQLRRRRPMTRYVHTWNEESNRYMIDVNETLGFRRVDEWTAYQKRLHK